MLDAVSTGSVSSQKFLADRVGIAVGLVNALLRRAVNKGLVKVSQAPLRRYAYYLTPKGFAEKSRLVTEYLRSSLDFFRQARGEYAELLRRADSCGYRRLALVGAGDLAEIAALSAADARIGLIGVVDARTNREQICGLPVVRRLTDFGKLDAVILTDTQTAQASYAVLARHFDAERILVPSLLRVDPAALVPASCPGVVDNEQLLAGGVKPPAARTGQHGGVDLAAGTD